MEKIETNGNLIDGRSLINQVRLDLINYLHCRETKKLSALTDDKKIVVSLKRIDKLNRSKVKIARLSE